MSSTSQEWQRCMTPPMQRVRRASAAATEACGAGGLPRAQTQRRAPARVRASGRPPPRAACGPGGLPRAQTQRRGFLAFISRGAAIDYASDVEDIETERTHQGSVSESSPEQSYDLERDFTTSGPTLGSTFSAPRGPSQVQQLRKTQSKSITAPPVFAH